MPKLVDHAQRRNELVHAVWQVVAVRGIEHVTLRVIAEQAGCTTGRISHYFADRQALLEAALQAVHDAAKARMQALSTSEPPATILRNVLYEALPLDAQRALEWRVWLAFWGIAATNPRLGQFNDARYKEWHDGLRPIVGKFVAKRDLVREVQTSVALVDGLGMQLTLRPTTIKPEQAKAIVDRHVERYEHLRLQSEIR